MAPVAVGDSLPDGNSLTSTLMISFRRFPFTLLLPVRRLFSLEFPVPSLLFAVLSMCLNLLRKLRSLRLRVSLKSCSSVLMIHL